jgi:integrase
LVGGRDSNPRPKDYEDYRGYRCAPERFRRWESNRETPSTPIPEVGEQYRALVLVLAFCGLRWGEAAALRVKRVDLMRRRITVAESMTEVRGRLTWGTPKSHQTRSVPVPKFLAELLTDLIAGKARDDLAFTTLTGKPLRNLNWSDPLI